jgi:peptidoglycan/LPS O-acetylase OafA/YrhL
VGQSGVDLFFVLSGYLIYGTVIAKRVDYLRFMKRRVQRIYPTFLTVFVIYLVLSFVFPTENKIPKDPEKGALYVLQNLFLLPGLFDIRPIITVAWSLSYEFFFYLLIPILVAFTGMRDWQRLYRTFFFIALAVLHVSLSWTFSLPHFRLIMFLAGILLYESLNSYESGKTNRRIDWATLLLLAMTFPAIDALSDPTPFLKGGMDTGFRHILSQLLIFGSFFLLTFVCFSSRGLMKNLFSWTPIRWLGNMSYSYYLIHGLTLKGLQLALAPIISSNQMFIWFWILLPVSFLLTWVSSTFLFLLIEKRLSLQPARQKAVPVNVLQDARIASE